MRTAGIVCFWIACSIGAFSAPAGAWELIAYQQADYSNEDTPRSEATEIQLKDSHTLMRVCVEQRPLRVLHVDVVFTDKSSRRVQIRRAMDAGTCSRAVRVNNKIEKIIMVYDRPPARAPIVKVYAR
jgi:hypothetical protein